MFGGMRKLWMNVPTIAIKTITNHNFLIQDLNGKTY